MSLVADDFFRGPCAGCSPVPRTLALNYPIKKWAAALAIFAAILYDLRHGSRVGAERALVITLVMLVACCSTARLVDAQSRLRGVFRFGVRAEALLGASFQLSFAAVAALIAVSRPG